MVKPEAIYSMAAIATVLADHAGCTVACKEWSGTCSLFQVAAVRGKHLPGVRPGTIQLVDESEAGYIVAPHLSVNRDALTLHVP